MSRTPYIPPVAALIRPADFQGDIGAWCEYLAGRTQTPPPDPIRPVWVDKAWWSRQMVLRHLIAAIARQELARGEYPAGMPDEDRLLLDGLFSPTRRTTRMLVQAVSEDEDADAPGGDE